MSKNQITDELNRQLARALFPEGCGIAPTSFEITGLGAKMDEIPRIKVEGLLGARAMERLATVLKAGLNALEPVNRVTAPEIPSDRFPMASVPKTNFHQNKHVLLLMGGQWLRGGWNEEFEIFCSHLDGEKSLGWDRKNQPTAWRPL